MSSISHKLHSSNYSESLSSDFKGENKFFYKKNELLGSIINFKKGTSGVTLTPKQGVADDDSDVYFYQPSNQLGLVIKPGLSDARISVMAQEVLKTVNLEHTIPLMSLGTINNVISAQDIDKNYVIKYQTGLREYAIEEDTLIPLRVKSLPKKGILIKDPHSDSFFIVQKVNEEDKSVHLGLNVELEDENDYNSDGENFEQDKNSFSDGYASVDKSLSIEESWIDEFAETPFKLVHNADRSKYYLAPSSAMQSVTVGKDFNKFVKRHDFPYELVLTDDDGFEVKGNRVPSLFQKMINLRFSGAGKEGLDITKPSQERIRFYQRINRLSFIDSFISFMLTRSHDGKIERLKNDSNFLFEEMENGELKIIQIDLDNVMPTSNKPKNDKEPHPLRCGLMGFPMVDDELSERELAYLLNILA